MIRKPTIDEIPLIYSFYEQRNFSDERVFYSLDSFYSNIDRIRVSDIDDTPVGFMLFYDMGSWCFIDLLSVEKNHRGTGIGKELIDSLSDTPKWKYIFTSVIMDDKYATDFVKNTGFETNNQKSEWFFKKNS